MQDKVRRWVWGGVSVCFLTWVTGCATTPFDREKPVEVRQSIFGPSYQQDGKRISQHQLARRLEKLPASQESMRHYDLYKTFSILLGGIGGFMAGWYVGSKVSDKNVNDSLIYVGSGLIVLSIYPFGYLREEALANGIDDHNQSLRGNRKKKKASTWSVSPVLGMAPRGDGGMAGLRVAF